jgi:hypothetical protein
VTALLAWANLLERVLQENNAKSLRKSVALSIEEIYFRMSVAINETLLDYLMGEQISMIQNSVAVVASMARSHSDKTQPSVLAYLEDAHDMLRRLDPMLWKEFNDVVRYVLPLMIKSMEVGPDNLQEVGSILANERKSSMGSDTFPLSHD